MRGEQESVGYQHSGRGGSPPRAWRAAVRCRHETQHRRFTSTCVESSRTARSPRSRSAVHLHVRGEQRSTAHSSTSGRGSPPRAWRAAGRPHRRPRHRRFTSTCVESRSTPRSSTRTRAVHLHVRGEQVDRGSGASGAGGSPPRAWRAGPHQQVLVHHLRFTSTCVESRRG